MVEFLLVYEKVVWRVHRGLMLLRIVLGGCVGCSPQVYMGRDVLSGEMVEGCL